MTSYNSCNLLCTGLVHQAGDNRPAESWSLDWHVTRGHETWSAAGRCPERSNVIIASEGFEFQSSEICATFIHFQHSFNCTKPTVVESQGFHLFWTAWVLAELPNPNLKTRFCRRVLTSRLDGVKGVLWPYLLRLLHRVQRMTLRCMFGKQFGNVRFVKITDQYHLRIISNMCPYSDLLNRLWRSRNPTDLSDLHDLYYCLPHFATVFLVHMLLIQWFLAAQALSRLIQQKNALCVFLTDGKSCTHSS